MRFPIVFPAFHHCAKRASTQSTGRKQTDTAIAFLLRTSARASGSCLGTTSRVLKLTQPILATKAIDPGKLVLVVGHKNVTERKRLGSNK